MVFGNESRNCYVFALKAKYFDSRFKKVLRGQSHSPHCTPRPPLGTSSAANPSASLPTVGQYLFAGISAFTQVQLLCRPGGT